MYILQVRKTIKDLALYGLPYSAFSFCKEEIMQETCSSEIKELAKALLNVQRQLQPAMKDANNPFTKSNYASLKSVMETCRDALLDNGIWLCQYPVPVETPGCIGLATKLTHAESGQWQSSLAVVPLPKADPQGMGSAITYARRYTLTAMLGMITEDDDGEAARIDTKGRTRARRATNAPQTKNACFEHVSTRPRQGYPFRSAILQHNACREGRGGRGLWTSQTT